MINHGKYQKLKKSEISAVIQKCIEIVDNSSTVYKYGNKASGLIRHKLMMTVRNDFYGIFNDEIFHKIKYL